MSEFTTTSLTALFLQSSLQDSEADYDRALKNPDFPHWDEVVITASNSLQAEGYKKQIEYRRNRLPQNTEFSVVPDEGGRRIGSAGSTLSVIKLLKEKYGVLEGRKILVIHAGGNSSRCPQYSALGKIFAPLPALISGNPATLFDMLLITMASIPGRLKEGMLLLSGDVTLLFNPLMCDFGNVHAAVISFKETAETGRNHGVYVNNQVTGNVKRFLHKQPVEILRREGAVDERNMCSIDTGAIWLDPVILDRLYSLVDTEEKYRSVVNDRVRLSLYSDIAYCLAEDSTFEQYLHEIPEGSFCPELTRVREELWNAIGSYSMKLMNLAPAKFVHFGSIPEILQLVNAGVKEYGLLGWRKQTNSSISDDRVAGYNSILSSGAVAERGSYLEVSYVQDGASVGKNSYLSFVDIHSGQNIPDEVMLHGIKEVNGRFVCRILGIRDNPKNASIFGVSIEKLRDKMNTDLADTLWEAELYPECDTISEAVDAAINLYNIVVNDSGDIQAWKTASRKSLCSGFYDADPQAIIDWNRRMEELVRMDDFANAIRSGTPAGTLDLGRKELSGIQKEWFDAQINRLDTYKTEDFSYAIRLYYYLGKALGNDAYISKCFRIIADSVLHTVLPGMGYNESIRIAEKETVVRLPLRVNWGGGWTDTCPHCIENGGTVLNASVSLSGKLPVEVRLVRIPEKKIIMDSRDMDVHGEFSTIEPLQKTGDPFDPFALQKACLIACGIIPETGGDLESILDRLGGGIEMHSEVTNVPKGSGLGTSSILSAATVKAIFTFVGAEYSDDDIYTIVLAMEQIMTTGGGWQDQVGGLISGIKFITSQPGMAQNLKVECVEISEETKRELNERFAIIYTGQRRLARNLLRDVVGRYIGNETGSVHAHEEIGKIAAEMRAALEKGDVDGFAGLLNRHWSLSRRIDAGSTNTLIDQIFYAVDDLIDGRMCCGAGGGGFLQVILKKGVSRNDVHIRLKSVFQDFAVDVWDSEIVY